MRLAAEKKLKEGEVKVLVATASLELGIDIGTVDLVVQIGSPRAIAVALQRVGRSGHWRGRFPRGDYSPPLATNCRSARSLVRAIRQGDLDRIMIPNRPLDMLAQQIVAIVPLSGRQCGAGALARLTRFATRTLPRGQECPRRTTPAGMKMNSLRWSGALIRTAIFRARLTNAVLEMLSEGIASRRGRYGAYIHHDRVNRKLRARRGARLAAITSGGAIPETALFTVVAEPEGTMVGTLDEDFAVESNARRYHAAGQHLVADSPRRRQDRARVGGRCARAAPSVPFWRGEAPARTEELSLHVARSAADRSATDCRNFARRRSPQNQP